MGRYSLSSCKSFGAINFTKPMPVGKAVLIGHKSVEITLNAYLNLDVVSHA